MLAPRRSDPGDKSNNTMESIPTATVNAVDCDDPLLDLAEFFKQAARLDAFDYVGSFLKTSSQRMFPRPANYDDDSIEDLLAFMEMATYEDPIDDLVPFFEKACRWFVSL